MSGFFIRPLASQDREWVRQFIAEHWGAEFVVAHGRIYSPHELEGFVAVREAKILGLITYSVSNGECEIVTLNSVHPGMGIGTALMEAVQKVALDFRCKRLWLITTNDNLNSLRFYQKRGFVMVAIHRNAIEKSRQLKNIPLLGADDIPIRDEIELEMMLRLD
jgi:GNAT superfamily N-acetyltransferase